MTKEDFLKGVQESLNNKETCYSIKCSTDVKYSGVQLWRVVAIFDSASFVVDALMEQEAKELKQTVNKMLP